MMTTFGQLNIHWGWAFMVVGILTGATLGLWSFGGPVPLPRGHKDYADLPRRLNRLAHIACFMLPLINIVYGQYLDEANLTDFQKMLGSYCMIICMLGVPTLLFAASFYLPFKYLEVIPVSCGIVGLGLMSYAHLPYLFS